MLWKLHRMPLRSILATVIFGLTYLSISGLPIPGMLRRCRLRPSAGGAVLLPWLPRRRWVATLAGAIAVVLVGALSPRDALRAVDGATLGLLLGMMLLAGALRVAGVFDAVASYLSRALGGQPQALLFLVTALSGILSALLLNDAVCLMLTPLILEICDRAGLSPLPYLLALATGSNVGSAATLTGNPQNMIIGLRSAWPYLAFLAHLGPVAALGLVANAAILGVLFRGRLREGEQRPHVGKPEAAVGRRLRWPVLLTLAAVTLGFAAGANLTLVALCGGAAVLLLAWRRAPAVLAEVDGSLLVFFACLFVVVEAFSATGLPRAAFEAALPFFGHTAGRQLASFSAFTVLASNAFSNVPYVLLAAPWIPRFADPKLLWLALSAACTFAGNLTIVGSMANMIVAEAAASRLRISFWDYARVGVPITLATTAIAVVGLAVGG